VKEKEIQEELTSIRSLMERSSKFISLSGLSGILAGVYALIGSAIAYYIIYMSPSRHYVNIENGTDNTTYTYTCSLMAVAILVLIASLSTCVYLTNRKAKKNGQVVWGKTSRSLLFQMSISLITGGLLILILLLRGYYGIVAPASLIFYGLSLIGASNFTFTDIRYLGLSEILLGLIAACLPGYGLLFWAIGFGLLHIIYGSVMYLKHDR
jgi:hypothetical protein